MRRSSRQMAPLSQGSLVLLEDVAVNDSELRGQRLMKCVARLGMNVIHDSKRDGSLPWRRRFGFARIRPNQWGRINRTRVETRADMDRHGREHRSFFTCRPHLTSQARRSTGGSINNEPLARPALRTAPAAAVGYLPAKPPKFYPIKLGDRESSRRPTVDGKQLLVGQVRLYRIK